MNPAALDRHARLHEVYVGLNDLHLFMACTSCLSRFHGFAGHALVANSGLVRGFEGLLPGRTCWGASALESRAVILSRTFHRNAAPPFETEVRHCRGGQGCPAQHCQIEADRSAHRGAITHARRAQQPRSAAVKRLLDICSAMCCLLLSPAAGHRVAVHESGFPCCASAWWA